MNIPFDQYQRYKNTELLINSIRKEGEKFKILEVGANAHKNLEKFLPDDNVTYLDITLPEELKNDPQYILGDATDMNFEDGLFDIVVALDVYEHIPKNRRENFINEVHRVCNKIAIIAAPFNKLEVVEAEKRANSYFKSLSGSNHIWLIEHIEYELPCLEELNKYLSNNNINYKHFSHGSLNTWEKLTNMHLATVVFNELIDYKEQIDNYYNKFVFQNDYDKSGYRDFFVLNKGVEIETTFKYDKYENKIEELEQNFYNLLNLQSIKIIKQYNEAKNNIDNIKLYIDYGSGFNENSTLIKGPCPTKAEKLIFDEFNDEKISCIRIDPADGMGKFAFKNLVIKNKQGKVLDNVAINSNCDIKEDNILIFGHEDPQIIISIEDEFISSLEFTINKIVDYADDNELIADIIKKLNEKIIQKDGIIANQRSIISKLKKIKNKIFNK